MRLDDIASKPCSSTWFRDETASSHTAVRTEGMDTLIEIRRLMREGKEASACAKVVNIEPTYSHVVVVDLYVFILIEDAHKPHNHM